MSQQNTQVNPFAATTSFSESTSPRPDSPPVWPPVLKRPLIRPSPGSSMRSRQNTSTRDQYQQNLQENDYAQENQATIYAPAPLAAATVAPQGIAPEASHSLESVGLVSPATQTQMSTVTYSQMPIDVAPNWDVFRFNNLEPSANNTADLYENPGFSSSGDFNAANTGFMDPFSPSPVYLQESSSAVDAHELPVPQPQTHQDFCNTLQKDPSLYYDQPHYDTQYYTQPPQPQHSFPSSSSYQYNTLNSLDAGAFQDISPAYDASSFSVPNGFPTSNTYPQQIAPNFYRTQPVDYTNTLPYSNPTTAYNLYQPTPFTSQNVSAVFSDPLPPLENNVYVDVNNNSVSAQQHNNVLDSAAEPSGSSIAPAFHQGHVSFDAAKFLTVTSNAGKATTSRKRGASTDAGPSQGQSRKRSKTASSNIVNISAIKNSHEAYSQDARYLGSFELYSMDLEHLRRIYIPSGDAKKGPPRYEELYDHLRRLQRHYDYTSQIYLQAPDRQVPWHHPSYAATGRLRSPTIIDPRTHRPVEFALKGLKRLPALKLSSEERTKFPANRWMSAIPCISGRVEVSDIARANPPGIARALKNGTFKMVRVWWKGGSGSKGEGEGEGEGDGDGGVEGTSSSSFSSSVGSDGAQTEHELFEGLFNANVSYDDKRYEKAGMGSGASYGYSFWAIRSVLDKNGQDLGLGPYKAK